MTVTLSPNLTEAPWRQHGHHDKSQKKNYKKNRKTIFFLFHGVPEGHFDLKNVHALEVPESGTVKITEVKKQEMGFISSIWPQIKKIMALSFLQL